MVSLPISAPGVSCKILLYPEVTWEGLQGWAWKASERTCVLTTQRLLLPQGPCPPAAQPASQHVQDLGGSSAAWFLPHPGRKASGAAGNALVLWHTPSASTSRRAPSPSMCSTWPRGLPVPGLPAGLLGRAGGPGLRHSLHFRSPSWPSPWASGCWRPSAPALPVPTSSPPATGAADPDTRRGVVCGLSWALAPPAVLLTADACGLLRGTHPLACLRYHVARSPGCWPRLTRPVPAGLVLLVWVACCSRASARFFGAVLGSGLLLLVCGLLPPLLDPAPAPAELRAVRLLPRRPPGLRHSAPGPSSTSWWTATGRREPADGPPALPGEGTQLGEPAGVSLPMEARCGPPWRRPTPSLARPSRTPRPPGSLTLGTQGLGAG